MKITKDGLPFTICSRYASATQIYKDKIMKKINMITTLSPQKQYEIRRWFWMTIFLCMCAIMISCYFIVPQIMMYRHLKKDVNELILKTKEYATLTSTKDALKKEYDELYVRESKINGYKQQKKNPYEHIAEIVAACSNEIKLESVKFNKKEVEIEIVCPTAEHAQVLMKRLSASQRFSHIKMVALQQDMQNKQVRCNIKGKVIFQ